MRVITGEARGRRLLEPSDRSIRPTADKVKCAVFNIVQFHVEGCRFLDLFAGTGQMGIEALSRGAAEAVFVDRSREALALAKENLSRTGLSARARLVSGDALEQMGALGKFDIVFMDPPYSADILEKALQKAAEIDILKENGIILCESERITALTEPAGRYLPCGEYLYGRIKLTAFAAPAGGKARS